MSSYFICPNCGAQVRQGALACPECGSDEETGWSERAEYAHLLPGDGAELDTASAAPPRWHKPALAAVTALTICAFLVYLFPRAMWLIPLVLLAAGIAYFLARRQPAAGRVAEERLYRRLLVKARGDAGLAERLVEYERRRSPRAGRPQWLQDAIDRWERDQR